MQIDLAPTTCSSMICRVRLSFCIFHFSFYNFQCAFSEWRAPAGYGLRPYCPHCSFGQPPASPAYATPSWRGETFGDWEEYGDLCPAEAPASAAKTGGAGAPAGTNRNSSAAVRIFFIRCRGTACRARLFGNAGGDLIAPVTVRS